MVYCMNSPLTPLYLTDREGIALNIGSSLTPSLPFFGREGAEGESFFMAKDYSKCWLKLLPHRGILFKSGSGLLPKLTPFPSLSDRQRGDCTEHWLFLTPSLPFFGREGGRGWVILKKSSKKIQTSATPFSYKYMNAYRGFTNVLKWH